VTHIQLEHLTKTYPNTPIPAVDNLSLQVNDGEFVSLLGPSGGGKTTTLRMLAGLIAPDRGTIRFDGQNVTDVAAQDRGVAMVFQNHALFPHMTVAENIAFGLKMRRVDKATRERRVAEMMQLVRLPQLATRRPSELSGGQQQRVALARSLVTNPTVLLLDEPLSSLDAHLRSEMRQLILTVQQELKITTVMVTHDQHDAVIMSDRIALMFDGKLQQIAAPQDFYSRPSNEKVARFFGGINFIPCEPLEADRLKSPFGVLRHRLRYLTMPYGTLTIRPEHVTLAQDLAAPAAENTVAATITNAAYEGAFARYWVQAADVTLELVRRVESDGMLAAGTAVEIHLPPEHLWVMAAGVG
jgi:putative spermidine/putrescine transport system ATP-binding protein